MHGWNIIRTRPIRKTYGRAIPTFINNLDQHLTTIDVYADGAIDCWEFVDRNIFARRIASRWISTQPRIGDRISVFDLGSAKVAAGEWLYSPADIQALVEDSIRELNPKMVDLIDMQGDNIEVRGGVRYRKMGFADAKPFRVDSSGTELFAKHLPIFIVCGGESLLKQWFIYEDGLTQFGFGKELIALEEAANLLQNGTVTTRVADGSWITIDGLGKFKAVNGWWGITPSERIREARDEFAILQGQAGTRERCIAAHEAYEQDPTEANRTSLRLAYEAVPEHLRIFCGDMDSKDWPIQQILYGDKMRDL